MMKKELHELLTENGVTLATAESCTGGALAALITANPGASKYYVGGVVAYSDSSKTILIDVPQELILKHGAVSKEVALSMAEGVKNKLNADYALAVTGIAGPSGATPNKPVGTVWCAISTPTTTEAWQLQLKGSRLEIIQASCEALLHKLSLLL